VIIKAFSQSERKREIGRQPSPPVPYPFSCKVLSRPASRGGFNGRLRGFRWIISGGTKKKEKRRHTAVARCYDGAYAPLGVKSRDKEGRLHDYTVGYARYADNPTVDWSFANEPG